VVVLLEVGPTHFPFRAVPNPHHSDVEDDEALEVVVVVVGWEEVDEETMLEVVEGLHDPSRAVPKPQ